MKRRGEIYIVTNDINDKVYIGKTYAGYLRRSHQHKTDALRTNEDGWYISTTKFHISMREIGVEHFKVEKICEADEGELEKLEIYYIKLYNSYYNGYNATLGGDTGVRIEISDSDAERVLDLYSKGFSIVQIEQLVDLSHFIVLSVLRNHGVDTDKSFNNMKDTLDTPVYGVQRKCGQIVCFKNEYDAAVEIFNAGLSVQDTYYIKNDIRRSISETNYGVGTYKWFRTYEEAEKYSQGLTEKHRYLVDSIIGSPFVKVKLNKTYRRERVEQARMKREQAKKELDNTPLHTIDDRDTLAKLLLCNTVNQIAIHYNVSFRSMKNRLMRFGLPSDKYQIAEYRKTGVIPKPTFEPDYSINKGIDFSKVPDIYPPSKETLQYLILNNSLTKIAKLFEVHYSTITRLLKKYGLPYTKIDVDLYRKIVNKGDE